MASLLVLAALISPRAFSSESVNCSAGGENQATLGTLWLQVGGGLEKKSESQGSLEPTFLPIDGGENRACRGSNRRDNSAEHYVLHSVPSLSDCKQLCFRNPLCKGIEHNGARCEVWVREQGIQATVPMRGYTCLHQVSSGTTFEQVDGGYGRACRGATENDNARKYYYLSVEDSLDACKLRCLQTAACQGIEYSQRRGRCEVWVRQQGIETSVASPGRTCLRLTRAPTFSSSTPHPGLSEFEAIDGGTNRACRGAAPRDNLRSYYSLKRAKTLRECKYRCITTAGCQGIEYNSRRLRCEIWLRSEGIQSTVAAKGFTCLRHIAASVGTTSSTVGVIPVISSTTTATSSMPPLSCCGSFSSWPDVDNGVTCGSCTALVLTAPYSGRCDLYCKSFGHVCVSAAEEEEEDCRVKFTKTCDEEIQGTSDMLCSCRRPDTVNATTCSVPTSPMPAQTTTTTTATTAATTATTASTPTTTAASTQTTSKQVQPGCCDSFNLWPDVDNGVTCDACTALVLTAPNGGRCDKYCESFGHVCVSAAEEVNEDCQVQYTKSCDEPITGTSDMLCTCRKPDTEASCSSLASTTVLTTRPPSPGPRRIEVRGRQLHVNGKPVHLKGVAWNPVPKGGKHPFDLDFSAFVEQDARLMQQMGINAVRTYEPITDRAVLDVLWSRGIWVLNSVYNWGGANSDSVVGPVNAVKDHPAILMWTIGNEWNYNGLYTGMSFNDCVARLDDAAAYIREHDTEHPIASIYGELSKLDQAIKSLSRIDVWGINAYRGKIFGDLFDAYAAMSEKPMFLGEYGADAFNSKIQQEDQQAQADATKELTEEIVARSSLGSNGVCLGGFIFEFNDEWHKDGDGSPFVQDTGGVAPGGGPYPDSTFNEEWWGLVKIDRSPRLAFRAYAGVDNPHNSLLEVE